PQGSSELRFQDLHSFHGLRLLTPRLGSLLAPCGENFHDAAGFASCCGPVSCTLPKRARPRASTLRSPQTSAGCYKGVLVPPLAGLPPASHRELAGRASGQVLLGSSWEPSAVDGSENVVVDDAEGLAEFW